VTKPERFRENFVVFSVLLAAATPFTVARRADGSHQRPISMHEHVTYCLVEFLCNFADFLHVVLCLACRPMNVQLPLSLEFLCDFKCKHGLLCSLFSLSHLLKCFALMFALVLQVSP
jgi:hypothetical protein